MALTSTDVARLADLARIDLTVKELEQFAGELGVVLDAVAQVSAAARPDIVPTSHALNLTNVFRDDVVRPSMPLADVFAMAPAVEQDGDSTWFRVPRILGEAA